MQNGCGYWELCQDSVEVSHGQKMYNVTKMPTNRQCSVDGIVISKDEVYSYLSSKGLEIGTSCQLIQSLTVSDKGKSCHKCML